jgi:ribosomal-protein-serine acetyltransferase
MFPIEAGATPNGRIIELRLLELEHAEELFRVIDANRASLRQWLPWLDLSNSPEDTAEHIRQSIERFETLNGFSAGIWVDGQLCGAIGLHAIDARHRHSSIGYWLAAAARGTGVMTQACRAVIGAGFRHYGLHRIEIRCATGNHKSGAIPRRLGFTYEGTIREAEWLYDHFVDLEVHSMLEQEWPSRAA